MGNMISPTWTGFVVRQCSDGEVLARLDASDMDTARWEAMSLGLWDQCSAGVGGDPANGCDSPAIRDDMCRKHFDEWKAMGGDNEE